MRAAFKEWAIIVDALGQGRQILILRKGGIREEGGKFSVDQSRFLLFPTLFHQQRDYVIAEEQKRFDEIQPYLSPPNELHLEYYADIAGAVRLESLAAAHTLRGQHAWREEVIARRFDWGGEKAIFALAVRVYRLPAKITLPMLGSYGGCKSWIDLESEVDINGANPVLSQNDFDGRLQAFEQALAGQGTGLLK